MKKREFIIDTFTRNGGTFEATGWCGEQNIKIGDCFNKVYEDKVLFENGQFEELGIKNERELLLQVKSIILYGVEVEELDRRLSGILTLTGVCNTEVKEGETLANS